MKTAEEWRLVWLESNSLSWPEIVKRAQVDALELIEKPSERLRAFCVENPLAVRDIPDEIWVPFCDSLLEAQKLISFASKQKP